MNLSERIRRSRLPLFELFFLLGAELLASVLISLVFLLLGAFDYTVITGCALGILVVLANMLILAVSVNRAIDRVEEARGKREMTEEESAAFVEEHKSEVQGAMKLSLYLRTLLMFATLLAAFLIGVFNVFATLIPMLLWRPLFSVAVTLKPKFFPEEVPSVKQAEDGEQPDAPSEEEKEPAPEEEKNETTSPGGEKTI